MLVSWTCFRIIQPSSCLPFCLEKNKCVKHSFVFSLHPHSPKQPEEEEMIFTYTHLTRWVLCKRKCNSQKTLKSTRTSANLQVEAWALRHGAEGRDGCDTRKRTHQHKHTPAVELIRWAHLETPSWEDKTTQRHELTPHTFQFHKSNKVR